MYHNVDKYNTLKYYIRLKKLIKIIFQNIYKNYAEYI